MTFHLQSQVDDARSAIPCGTKMIKVATVG